MWGDFQFWSTNGAHKFTFHRQPITHYRKLPLLFNFALNKRGKKPDGILCSNLGLYSCHYSIFGERMTCRKLNPFILFLSPMLTPFFCHMMMTWKRVLNFLVKPIEKLEKHNKNMKRSSKIVDNMPWKKYHKEIKVANSKKLWFLSYLSPKFEN